MAQFYVNLDHVATIREARRTPYPDVCEAALQAERSGAVDGITLHLREDRRHVHDDDVRIVRSRISLPFNFEMSVAEEIVALAVATRPAQATLVPERREELTTEGGLDLIRHGGRVAEVIRRLQNAGILVSLFIDPDAASVDLARTLGATHVELHTGTYAAAAPGSPAGAASLLALVTAAARADALGLVVNAGHGLTTANVAPVAAIRRMNDLNIGHAVVARALFVGLDAALREMAAAIQAAAPR